MLEITFLDGRVRTVTPQYYTTGEPFGGCLMTEFELRLDDLSEGLFLEVSHHRLSTERKKSGWGLSRPSLQGDASLMLLDAEELKETLEAKWNGEVVAARIASELVVLAKANALMSSYSVPRRDYSLLASIGCLSELVGRDEDMTIEGGTTGDIDYYIESVVAQKIGVSCRLLKMAVEAWNAERRMA